MWHTEKVFEFQFFEEQLFGEQRCRAKIKQKGGNSRLSLLESAKMVRWHRVRTKTGVATGVLTYRFGRPQFRPAYAAFY